MNAKRINMRDARLNLAEIVMRARYKNESFLVAKHGEPMALIIPISQIPTLQPHPLHAVILDEPTDAQKKWGALARMVPADTKK